MSMGSLVFVLASSLLGNICYHVILNHVIMRINVICKFIRANSMLLSNKQCWSWTGPHLTLSAWRCLKILLPYSISLPNSNMSHQTQMCPPLNSQWPNHFEILHRARHWHCRALCKILKWLDHWNGCYERTIFFKIWVKMSFKGISYMPTAPRCFCAIKKCPSYFLLCHSHLSLGKLQ